MGQTRARAFRKGLLLGAVLLGLAGATLAHADTDEDERAAIATPLPTGQRITPTAATGAVFQKLDPGLPDFPGYRAGQAVNTALSPDGTTLLVLTSGFNLLVGQNGAAIPGASTEYVFVYDVTHRAPVRKQVLQVPNTYVGLAFAPDGAHFYVSGGVDDEIHAYAKAGGAWSEDGPPIKLGHTAGNGRLQKPTVSGLAVTADGRRLVAANVYNDSLSIIDLAARRVRAELDLRPGVIDPSQAGMAGGENPFAVVVSGNSAAFVSSQRDREVDVVDLAADESGQFRRPTLLRRIKLDGNPNAMVLSRDSSLLYVAADNSDSVYVIDARTGAIRERLPTTAPPSLLKQPEDYRGAAPNGLALAPDGRRLYVTNGGTNSVAVIALDPDTPHQVIGLIPTGWYPNAVSVGSEGGMLYVVNGRGSAGPNPKNCTINDLDKARANACRAANQYVLELEKAGFLSLPVPGRADLGQLTRQVAANNRFDVPADPADQAVMEGLRQRIKHVIYVIKENRTYDQVLGDLDRGNGDPALVEFGAGVTPNLHQLAKGFVTLDNFFDSGEVSGDGWPWSTSARETDVIVKTMPLNYAKRGAPYDAEGENRNVNVALPTVAERQAADPRYPNDPNLLPGTNNVAAPDGPQGQAQQGYLWNAAFRAGLSVRNYGFFEDLGRYNSGDAAQIPPVRDPAASGTVVAYPSDPDLAPVTDPYFRGFDNAFPDIYREREWEREFNQYVAKGNLPNLELVRLMHDHMGNFTQAIDGIDTPETQVADNDYAVGRLIETVANSPYRDSTLIFVVEDDAQDGPDHVDAHRSTAFVVGPFVRHGAVVSERYTTVNMLRTIEDVLGIDHLSLYDAYQRPMTDAFDLKQPAWSFVAEPSPVLRDTQALRNVPLKQSSAAPRQSTHPAAWWAERTRGYDWSVEDRIDAVGFNKLLWEGLAGNRPYPTERDGKNYSADRARVLRTRSQAR